MVLKLLSPWTSYWGCDY